MQQDKIRLGEQQLVSSQKMLIHEKQFVNFHITVQLALEELS